MNKHANNKKTFEEVLDIFLESRGDKQKLALLLRNYPEYREELLRFIEVGKTLHNNTSSIAPRDEFARNLVQIIKKSAENVNDTGKQNANILKRLQQSFKSFFTQLKWSKMAPVGIMALLLVMFGWYQFNSEYIVQQTSFPVVERSTHKANNLDNTTAPESVKAVGESVKESSEQILLQGEEYKNVDLSAGTAVAGSDPFDLKGIQFEEQLINVGSELDDYFSSEMNTSEFDQALLEF